MRKWEYARVLVDRGDVSVTFSHQEGSSQRWPRVINACAISVTTAGSWSPQATATATK